MSENKPRVSPEVEIPTDIGLVFKDKRQSKVEKLMALCEETIIDNELDTMVRKAVIGACEKELARIKEKLK